MKAASTLPKHPARRSPRAWIPLVLLAVAWCSNCAPYRDARIHQAAERALDAAREVGFPVRLVAVQDAGSLEAAGVRERGTDTWSTLLLFSARDVRVEPGVRLDVRFAREAEARARAALATPSAPAESALADAFLATLETRYAVPRPTPERLPFQSTRDAARDYAFAIFLFTGISGLLGLLALSRRARARLAAAGRYVAGWLLHAPAKSWLEAPSSLPRPGLLLALTLLAVFAVYVPTLGAPFLWDDRKLILDEVMGEKHPLTDYLLHPFWRSQETGVGYRGFFRPLATLSFALDAHLGGGNPSAFHLSNSLLHLGAVLLLYLSARKLGARPVAAVLAAACFGLAPRLSENVAWISGRTDVLAGLFGLAALYCYPFRFSSEATPFMGRAWLAASLILLALLSKEVALAFVLVFLLDELAHWRRRRSSAGESLGRLLPLGVVLSIYGVLRHRALGGTLPGGTQYAYGGARGFATLEAVGRYALLLLDFARPRTQIGFLPLRVWTFVVLGAAVSCWGAWLVSRGLRRILSRTAPGPDGATLGLWLCLGGLLPVIHLVPLAVGVVAADRFLYLPLVGLCLAASVAASRYEPTRLWRAALIAAAIAVSSIAGTLLRVRDYGSELSFWLRALETTDTENTAPLSELANVCFRAQEYDVALQLHMRALRQQRRYFIPGATWINQPLGELANVEAALGDYHEAIRLGEKLIAEGAASPRHVHNLALTYLHLEDFANARRLSSLALAQSPDYFPARQTLEQLPKLEQERAAVAVLPPKDRLPALAAYLAHIGARVEAQSAYVQVLATRAGEADVVEPAWQYLILFADTPILEAAARRYPLTDAELRAALELRLSTAAEIAERLPSMRPYFARYDGAEVGL